MALCVSNPISCKRGKLCVRNHRFLIPCGIFLGIIGLIPTVIGACLGISNKIGNTGTVLIAIGLAMVFWGCVLKRREQRANEVGGSGTGNTTAMPMAGCNQTGAIHSSCSTPSIITNIPTDSGRTGSEAWRHSYPPTEFYLDPHPGQQCDVTSPISITAGQQPMQQHPPYPAHTDAPVPLPPPPSYHEVVSGN